MSNAYLRLFRLNNGIMGIVGLLITAFIAAGYNMFDHWLNLLIGAAIVFAFVAGGNALNDYVDVDIDKTAHPDRPLPKGELTPRDAKLCGIGGLVLAVILSAGYAVQGFWIATAIVTLGAVMMIAYELTLKQRGFIGNICIALLTGFVFLFGGGIVGDISQVWVLALLAALVSVGREITKDIEDEESDRESRTTLPMIIGDRKAGAVAAAFFILGPLLSLIPLINGMFGILYLTVLIADLLFIYCAALVFSDPHKSEKTAKIAMFIALISFILGVVI